VAIYSEQPHDRAKATLEKEVKREKEKLENDLLKVGRERFCCKKDALKSITTLTKKLKYHSLEQQSTKFILPISNFFRRPFPFCGPV